MNALLLDKVNAAFDKAAVEASTGTATMNEIQKIAMKEAIRAVLEWADEIAIEEGMFYSSPAEFMQYLKLEAGL